MAGSDFKYAKIMTIPFFGAGLVEVPPEGYKKAKNSRKMQMVFFVHEGKVLVEVGATGMEVNEFTLSKGGCWVVPRGKLATVFFLSRSLPASVICVALSTFPRNRRHYSPEDVWLCFGGPASLVDYPRARTVLHGTASDLGRQTSSSKADDDWSGSGELTATTNKPTMPFSGPDRVPLGIETAASLATAACDSAKPGASVAI